MKPVKSRDTNITFFSFTFKYCKLHFPPINCSSKYDECTYRSMWWLSSEMPWKSALLFDGPSFFCGICHFYMIWTVSILWKTYFCLSSNVIWWESRDVSSLSQNLPPSPQNSIFGKSEQSQSYSLLDKPSRYSFAHSCQVKKWCGHLIWCFCGGGIAASLLNYLFFSFLWFWSLLDFFKCF